MDIEFKSMNNKATIYVDADACPVKDEILDIAKSFGVQLFFIASYAHYGADRQGAWIFVDPDREAADLYIVNHAKRGDVVVTQDMGLASLLSNKEIFLLTPRGDEIIERDIPRILERRYLSYKALAAGRRIKGPKPFTDADRKKFSAVLTNLLCRLKLWDINE